MPDISTQAFLAAMVWLLQSAAVPFLVTIGTTIGATVLIWIVEGADDFSP